MHAAQVLDRAVVVAPRLADWLKRRFVEHAVPANRSMGIRIGAITPEGTVELRLRDRRRNRNVGGTIHGGVLLALAETVHGVAVLWRFPPSRHRMVTQRAMMTYLAPARGVLTVRFGLDETTAERLGHELDAANRSELELKSTVTDAQGTPVAQLTARYRVDRRPD